MANKFYALALDITPRIAHSLIQCLKHPLLDVEFYVAPYEADAQLAYLFKTGQCDVVITEDSDLMGGFGVEKCFFKMDHEGWGDEIDMTKFSTVAQFENFTFDMLQQSAIISGCDYIEKIKGIGFVNAAKFIAAAGPNNLKGALEAIKLVQSGSAKK